VRKFHIFNLILFFLFSGCSADGDQGAVRIGYFPNLTHAQALVGRAQGEFEKVFGPQAQVRWTSFNAGPSVIEAIFAGQLDIAYVGPNPAINGYVKSGGEAVRVVAGAAGGGAALVVRKDSGISKPADFHGKKIASPQLGNTQDVALRSWLSAQGLTLKETGGGTQVIPLSNADQQTLFIKKEIDAAWTIEPWVSLLVLNADAKVFLEESSLWPKGRYATTVVLVRKKFLDTHLNLVKKFLKTHEALTGWIVQNPAQAKKIVSDQIQKETGKPLPPAVLDQAWTRLFFTTDKMKSSIVRQAEAAFEAGFLKTKPDLSELFVEIG
jgi:NitT/TauT family transport system substrate-binding protein